MAQWLKKLLTGFTNPKASALAYTMVMHVTLNLETDLSTFLSNPMPNSAASETSLTLILSLLILLKMPSAAIPTLGRSHECSNTVCYQG